MFLYELAIERGVRSAELIALAADLGLGDLTAATTLDPDQVAALRGRLAGGPPGAVGPATMPGGPSHPDAAAPSGPMAWPPPPPPGPPGVGGAPLSGDPAAPPPPPPPPHRGPQFEAPQLPPMPPDGTGGPLVPPTGERAGATVPQKVAVGGAVLLALLLFGYMVAGTGPDRAREREIAASAESEVADRAVGAPGGTEPPATSAPVEPTTTTSFPVNVHEPVDVDRFCQGGLGVSAFELRVVAAQLDADYPELLRVLAEGRDRWLADVDVLASGAPPINQDDVEEYRSRYTAIYDVYEASSSFDEAYARVGDLALVRAYKAGQQFGNLIAFHC